MMTRLKAVAFDLWETLITDTPDASRQQERLRLERMESILAGRGFTAAAQRIEQAYRGLWHRCNELYWSSDIDIPCRRQIEHFLEALDLEPASFDEAVLAELEHAYARAALDVLPSPVAGAVELLDAVHSRELSVGLISNTGRTPGYVLREVLERLGMARLIDAMVFSNEHGQCKPQPSIFERLRGALGVDYSEILFVGDNLYADVYGAQRCGMRAVHFVPPFRGTAVAPAVDHDLEIVADATISSLAELPAIVEQLSEWRVRSC
jgi:putative hydrolase of the HAD superfamily